MPKMLNIKEIPNTDGRICLFQRPINQGRRQFWQVRVRKRDGKYSYQSTKTTDEYLAVSMARKIYHDLWLIEQADLSYVPEAKRKIKNFYQEWVKTVNVSPVRHRFVKGIWERYLLDFFGEYKPDEVSQAKWDLYVDYRIGFWKDLTDKEARKRRVAKKPSVTLMKSELQTLRQMLMWCERKGYAKKIQQFSVKDKSRLNNTRSRSKNIEPERFRKIKNLLDKRAHYPYRVAGKDLGKSMFDVTAEEAQEALLKRSNDAGKGNYVCNIKGLNVGITAMPTHTYYRLLMFYFIQTSYFSLVRPSRELTSLKWSDVSIKYVDINGEKEPMALLTNIISKKGRNKRRWLTGRGTIALLRWRVFASGYGFGKDEDYIFADYRQDGPVKAGNVGAAFTRVLRIEGLRKDLEGRNITLYSFCRSQGIRVALENYTVAEVAMMSDVSIDVLQKFYMERVIYDPKPLYARTENKKAIRPKDETYGAHYLVEKLGLS